MTILDLVTIFLDLWKTLEIQKERFVIDLNRLEIAKKLENMRYFLTLVKDPL